MAVTTKCSKRTNTKCQTLFASYQKSCPCWLSASCDNVRFLLADALGIHWTFSTGASTELVKARGWEQVHENDTSCKTTFSPLTLLIVRSTAFSDAGWDGRQTTNRHPEGKGARLHSVSMARCMVSNVPCATTSYLAFLKTPSSDPILVSTFCQRTFW